MYLKDISLLNFKNHTESSLIFNNKINCFVGDNGSGKTNILDAIHYLSLSKSYFNKIDIQNIKFQENFFMIKGNFVKDKDSFTIHCGLQQGDKKVLKSNNKRYQKFSDHIGRFPVVIITPTDSNIITNGSEIRRRYINSSISQYNNEYLNSLIAYNKTLKQRNSLLKNLSEGKKIDSTMLEIFDNQLVNFGTLIFQERKNFLEKLISVFRKYYSLISRNEELVNICYSSQLNDNNFKKLLKDSFDKDKLTHYTNVGIHKDDLIFKMNDFLIKKIASQGQQKSFLIALKLAQFNFMEKQLGFKPILLFDDIFDKLDETRVSNIISFVNKGAFGQVFLTDTDLKRTESILKLLSVKYSIFVIENGSVKI